MSQTSRYRVLDERLGDLAAAWVDRVLRRPRAVVVLCAATSVALVAWALPHLGLDSNEDALFSKSVSYAELRRDFKEAFPALVDPILVVVDGANADLAHDAAEALRKRLLEDPEHFPTVYQPGGGPFFETHGLLYLETSDLADLADRLVEMQPYLGTLARDGTLRGFFGLLGDAAEAAERGELQRLELASVLDRVSASVEALLAGNTRDLSWAELMLGRSPEPADLRRLILVQPVVDYGRLEPAAETLEALRAAVTELGLDRHRGVRVRLTGLFPLSYEESRHVTAQSSLAGVASFVLVSLVLATGLRSTRLVLAILACLLVGLAWTTGFAALAIGHLNLISVAFAVLFIGLSVDFGIHLGVRYREILARGEAREDALRQAASSVGGSLVVCSFTTAVAFYAFIPTDFVGIAELGAIAGTGMFISLFLNLTLLPALLVLGRPPAPPNAPRPPPAVWGAFLALPIHHARAIATLTALVTVGALFLLPRVHFDLSPLRVRDPATESVQTLDDLLADGMAFPWNVNALTADRAEADRIATSLAALPTVDRTLTLSDYVPAAQQEKLAILDEAGFLLLPTLEPREARPAPTTAEQLAALRALESKLAALAGAPVEQDLAGAAARLRSALAAFGEEAGDAALAASKIAALEASLLDTFPGQLRVLRRSLRAGPVEASDLPAQLRRQTVAPDGRVRVEVFPSEDLNDNAALARYVESVTALAPRAFGEGIVIHESGRIVVRAFRQALAIASVLVGLSLLLVWRKLLDAALVALPLALASVFTVASSVLLDVPFNFANVIVIPLLLGMGVDTGIHLVHRLRYETLPGGNLLRTSTARAVLLSALTTIASFGTLGFTTHRGMASLGQLLALGIAWIVVCNLLVLPVVVARTRLGGGSAPASTASGSP